MGFLHLSVSIHYSVWVQFIIAQFSVNQDVFCFLVVCAPFRNVGVPLFLAAAPTTGRVHTVLFAPLNHVVSGRARLRVLSHPGTLIFHQLDISPWSDCVTFLREMWRAVIVLLPQKKKQCVYSEWHDRPFHVYTAYFSESSAALLYGMNSLISVRCGRNYKRNPSLFRNRVCVCVCLRLPITVVTWFVRLHTLPISPHALQQEV